MNAKAGSAYGWRAALAALLSALSAGVGAAPAEFLGDYLRQSRIVYPLRVGAWEARGEHRYEPAALGVSVHYENPAMPGARLDLYAYPGGALLEPAFSRAAAQTVQELEAVARANDAAAFEPGHARAFSLRDPAAELLGEYAPRPRSYAMQMGAGGRVLQSSMAIALRDMHFLKVRLSLPADRSRREQVRSEAEGFLRAIFAQLSIANTGSCSRPLQVVPMPANGRRPDDLLASNGDGTPREIWVSDDRIYLAPAIMADARLLPAATAFGQSLHDALRGRCVSPDDMDIRVPEGMREIRMEYVAPAGPVPAPPPADAAKLPGSEADTATGGSAISAR